MLSKPRASGCCPKLWWDPGLLDPEKGKCRHRVGEEWARGSRRLFLWRSVGCFLELEW